MSALPSSQNDCYSGVYIEARITGTASKAIIIAFHAQNPQNAGLQLRNGSGYDFLCYLTNAWISISANGSGEKIDQALLL